MKTYLGTERQGREGGVVVWREERIINDDHDRFSI